MEQRGLVRSQELYQNSAKSVQVHSGFDYIHDRKVVIKTLLCANVSEVNSTLEEGLTHIKLEHPNICKIYDCFLEEDQRTFKVIFVIEFQHTDLYKEIESRRQSRRKWSEVELLDMMQKLVGVFAFLQSKGACHRDIKPQNIFLSGTGQLKVGDFGSASRSLEDGEEGNTLVGTPLYLSPALRAEFLKKIIGLSVTRVVHNPYKSDVYSLGLTLLHMARLQPPNELASLDDVETKQRTVLEQLPYSARVKDILRRMLELEESARPDFMQLKGLLCGKDPLEDWVRELNGSLKTRGDVWTDVQRVVRHGGVVACVSFACIECGREQRVIRGLFLGCGKVHGFCSAECSQTSRVWRCPLCEEQYSAPKRCFFCAETLDSSALTLPCSIGKQICSRNCYSSMSANELCPLCGQRHAL